MLNPNQGYKKFVMKLKQRYTCTVNKTELTAESLGAQQLLLLGGPRQPFTGHELQHIAHYVEKGGNALIIMQEGGETRLDTNINAFLE